MESAYNFTEYRYRFIKDSKDLYLNKDKVMAHPVLQRLQEELDKIFQQTRLKIGSWNRYLKKEIVKEKEKVSKLNKDISRKKKSQTKLVNQKNRSAPKKKNELITEIPVLVDDQDQVWSGAKRFVPQTED
ncbi:hypothetical protein RhiirB3_395798 [Rhizophagus irregularis]|nr:hypothetical protein RhiirB3_395798 [Rhizophagus irregularis]